MSDEKRLPDPSAVLLALPRGAALILRHGDAASRRALAHRLAPLCRRRGIALLIAGDWRLAAEVNAAGIHLGEMAARRGPAPGARLWLQSRARLLTAAAHGAAALARAAGLKADAALLAPVFPTASHPARIALGPTRSAALIGRARLPVIGLGGITQANVNALRASGAQGIAGIGFGVSI